MGIPEPCRPAAGKPSVIGVLEDSGAADEAAGRLGLDAVLKTPQPLPDILRVFDDVMTARTRQGARRDLLGRPKIPEFSRNFPATSATCPCRMMPDEGGRAMRAYKPILMAVAAVFLQDAAAPRPAGTSSCSWGAASSSGAPTPRSIQPRLSSTPSRSARGQGDPRSAASERSEARRAPGLRRGKRGGARARPRVGARRSRPDRRRGCGSHVHGGSGLRLETHRAAGDVPADARGSETDRGAVSVPAQELGSRGSISQDD